MRISVLFLFYIIPVFTVYSCVGSDDTTKNADSYLQSGAYYYFQMSDSNNRQLVEGKMKIAYKKNLIISGTYEISKIFSDSVPGINTMKGTFSGNENKDDKSVFFNMNPKISDNNIFFEFNVSNNKIEGRWYHSTMLGKKAVGKLSGNKISD